MDKQEQASASAPVTTVRLQDIATAYGQSAALMAAAETFSETRWHVLDAR